MITKLVEIVQKVKSLPKKKLAVACGEDPHTIEAVGKAVREGLVDAVLTGDKVKIQKVAGENQVNPDLFEIIDESDKVKALQIALSKIKNKECDFLMKGLMDSSAYMKGIIQMCKELNPKGSILSHAAVIELPEYHKLLIASDIAVIPYPDLKLKVAITNYAVSVAHKLGIEIPKVALICAVEKVNLKMESTLEAAAISKMGDRGQIRNALIDGPLSLDVAVSKESKAIKKVESKVAGDADILIFPNIEAGNVFFKTCTNLAKGEIAAIVTGAPCPCILTSRADSEQSKFYSIALGALMA